MDTYSILYNDQPIGEALVGKQGLFYRIHCNCRINSGVPFRITVIGDRKVDLGICVPTGDGFGLTASIPIAKVGNSQIHFLASPRSSSQIMDRVSVSATEPFPYLASLKNAYWVGQNEIAFRREGKSPIQRDSDQSP